MRESLKHLENKISWIDTDNLYQAVADIKDAMQELLTLIDQALPKEVESD